jgi:hypothetical protein
MALAGDHVQVLLGGYDLTGDSQKVKVQLERVQHDVTCFGDGAHKFINARRKLMVEHEGLMNPQTARSHPILRSSSVSGVFSVLVGQNAAPALGDVVFSAAVLQAKYRIGADMSQAIPFMASFSQNLGETAGWGRLLAAPTTISISTAGGILDNAAATTNGGVAFLHLLGAAASDTYSFRVEASTTGAFGGEETLLGTFSLNASSLGSERLALTGTIPRYLRWRAIRTGSAEDNIRLALSVQRY